MAMTCQLGLIAWHLQRLAERCRLDILKLVSFYYHLKFQLFHSPTAAAPKSLQKNQPAGQLSTAMS
jgi:hypothetical protein